MHRSFIFAILITFMACGSCAQWHCGSRPVNGKNRIAIAGLQTEWQEWASGEPGEKARRYLLDTSDSVVIYRNGAVAGHFLASGGAIVSPELLLRDESGRVRSQDSFRLSSTTSRDKYYKLFAANLAVRREYYPDGIPSLLLRRDISGKDSLLMEWSPEGMLRRKITNGTEELYAPDGSLRLHCSDHDSVFYRNGILSRAVKDTLMLNQWVTRTREYSGKGTLRSEKWHSGGEPVATWREYNSEGNLIRTTRHRALVNIPLSYAVMDMPASEIYVFVSQQAEYRGGKEAFTMLMEAGLLPVFTRGDFPLRGEYRIRFRIREDGKAEFLSAEGQNAESIRSSLRNVIEDMPSWIPSRYNGVSLSDAMVLRVRVQEM